MLSPFSPRAKRAAVNSRVNTLVSRLENALAREFTAMVERARLRLQDDSTVVEAVAVIEAEADAFASKVGRAYETIGQAELKRMARKLGLEDRVRFDPNHVLTAQVVRRARTRFIQEFRRAQRISFFQAVARDRHGTAMTGTAEVIHKAVRRGPLRQALGLTPYQEQIVENYRNSLVAGSVDALNRVLRDRRFEPTVERAVYEGEPLTTRQINRMTQRYRERWIAFRARTIARTQALTTVNLARHSAFTQLMEQTNLDQSSVLRTWNAILDERTRDTHAVLDGDEVQGMETPFFSPSGAALLYPGDPTAPAEEVVNCRCSLSYKLLGVDVDDDTDF